MEKGRKIKGYRIHGNIRLEADRWSGRRGDRRPGKLIYTPFGFIDEGCVEERKYEHNANEDNMDGPTNGRTTEEAF